MSIFVFLPISAGPDPKIGCIPIKHKLGMKYFVLKSCCQESLSDFFLMLSFRFIIFMFPAVHSSPAVVFGPGSSPKFTNSWKVAGGTVGTVGLSVGTVGPTRRPVQWPKLCDSKRPHSEAKKLFESLHIISRLTLTNSRLRPQKWCFCISVPLFRVYHGPTLRTFLRCRRSDDMSQLCRFLQTGVPESLGWDHCTFGDEDVANVDPVEIIRTYIHIYIYMNGDSKSQGTTMGWTLEYVFFLGGWVGPGGKPLLIWSQFLRPRFLFPLSQFESRWPTKV